MADVVQVRKLIEAISLLGVNLSDTAVMTMFKIIDMECDRLSALIEETEDKTDGQV